MRNKEIKITELGLVTREEYGRIALNGVTLEKPEEATLDYLVRHGFNIEVIQPNNTPRVKNPDVLIMGTIWEVKTPTTSNQKTLKKRIHKASKQANRIIFDLRGIRKNYEAAEAYIIKMFKGNRSLRRMFLINKSGKLLDFQK